MQGKVETVLAGGKVCLLPEGWGDLRCLSLKTIKGQRGRRWTWSTWAGGGVGIEGVGKTWIILQRQRQRATRRTPLPLLSMCAVSHLMTRARAKQRVLGPLETFSPRRPLLRSPPPGPVLPAHSTTLSPRRSVRCVRATAPLGTKATATATGMKEGGRPLPVDMGNTTVYRPANAEMWEQQEEAILHQMQSDDERQKSRPLEREPAGIDQFMLEKPSEEALALYKSEDKTIAAVDKLIKSNNKDAAQIRTKTQVRPGYDLLRVGNYHEDPAYPLPDIAFFHHRLSMDKVPQREALIRSACLAVRELCVTVFDYDARLVTLFFEEGPCLASFVKRSCSI